MQPQGFERVELGEGHALFVGRLPSELGFSGARFEELWSLHPERFHELTFFGKRVAAPRWSQAYGRDYRYSGGVHAAVPVPARLAPLLEWGRSAIDTRLDGVLVNWYDRELGHYIGKHRDSTLGLVRGAPIVTISCGDRRVFRLRPWRGSGRIDLEAEDGAVFVMPFDTNRAWMHEIRGERRAPGRRVSVTLRAFLPAGAEGR